MTSEVFRHESRRHQVQLSDEGAQVAMRALAAYHGFQRILSVTPGAAPDSREANWTTHVHAIIQDHARGQCDCPTEPTPGGTP